MSDVNCVSRRDGAFYAFLTRQHMAMNVFTDMLFNKQELVINMSANSNSIQIGRGIGR